MDLDDEVCLCFRVTKRKLLAHLRINRPKVASQMANCGGAGTGCGWCVPFLKRMFAEGHVELPTAEDYAAKRSAYRETGERDLTDSKS
jgi:NAD(P)H-nitrite reductase large subunit